MLKKDIGLSKRTRICNHTAHAYGLQILCFAGCWNQPIALSGKGSIA